MNARHSSERATRRKHLTAAHLFAILALCAGAPAIGAQISVGENSTVRFAEAHLDLGCGDLDITGTVSADLATLTGVRNFSVATGAFAAGTSVLELGGDFSNAGAFSPDAGRVRIVDACGSGMSRFSGSNDFYDLAVASAIGKQVIFPVNLPQSIAHSLTLQGAAGKLLDVASSVAGQRGVFALAANVAQNVVYVSARDNRAAIARIAPGAASLYHSVDAGNLVNWFAAAGGEVGMPAVPAHALGLGRWVLLTMLLVSAWFALRTQRRTHL